MSLLDILLGRRTSPPEPTPTTAPLSELPRLLAAGLVDGYDFRRWRGRTGECFVARTPAGQRWMAPQEPGVDGRASSRRFVPSLEQAHYSPLLAGLYQMGASEAEVIEHLFADGERRQREVLRMLEIAPLAAHFPREKP